MTGALGFLPGPGVDPETMRRTLDWIWDHPGFPADGSWTVRSEGLRRAP